MTADPHAETLAFPECVHCGFCLPACPTYDVLGTEMDNPRGRLQIMAALASGRIEPTEAVVRHLDLCLGCRACETACPSGVPYGRHLERARAALHSSWERPVGQRLTERLVLSSMGWHPAIHRLGFGLARLAERTGLLARLAGDRRREHLGLDLDIERDIERDLERDLERDAKEPPTPRPPGRLAAAARLLRQIPRRPHSLPYITPAEGPRRMRVGLLVGCINRWMCASTNAATVRLLSRAGCEVVIPPGQRCCGALHAHGGDLAGARRHARRTLSAFEAVGRLDAVVVNAAGCGSAMKAYDELLADEPGWAARAHRFAGSTRDALELLDELGLPAPRRQLRTRVAYHDACHLAHAQGVSSGPRRLLAQVPGLTLVPLEAADRCCGSAGIYNLLHPEVAEPILEDKLARLLASGAEVVAAANPGCLLQLASGIRRRGLPLQARHPLELLDEACS